MPHSKRGLVATDLRDRDREDERRAPPRPSGPGGGPGRPGSRPAATGGGATPGSPSRTPRAAPWLATPVAPLICGVVGLRRACDAPLREDRLVLAVRDQLLQRREDLVRERAALLGIAIPYGAVPYGLPGDDLNWPFDCFDDVRGDRRVGHPDLRAAARERQVGAVLVREHRHLHAGLAGRLALLVLRGRVGPPASSRAPPRPSGRRGRRGR